MIPFGKLLRAAARALGLSDADVARRSGLSERRYGHYVNGAREPDLATLLRICRTLDMSPNEVLGWSPVTARSSPNAKLHARLHSAVQRLSKQHLEVLVIAAEALDRHGR